MKRVAILIILLIIAVLAFTRCGNAPNEYLMPTPMLFPQLGIGPLDHIPESERWNPRLIFYATNRQRALDPQQIIYNNQESGQLALGLALVGFGSGELSWEDLSKASTYPDRETPVALSIAGVIEAGQWDPAAPTPTPGSGLVMRQIREAVNAARDRDILIYVHGAKVNFYNSCVFTAQLDHFMGRDMTPLAFAWPTHQNILAYGLGPDLDRAYRAGGKLADLIERLAADSGARRIHVLAWSAGGRVTTEALRLLRERHPDLDRPALLEKLRVGTVYLAAADVPRASFFENFTSLDDVAGRIIISATDQDDALMMAERFMGGGRRIGQKGGGISPEELQMLENAADLQVIDVSTGAIDRGFNITGHRYWIDHPWANTDVVLAIRSDLDPQDRGLVQSPLAPFLWIMAEDYPTRLATSLARPAIRIRATEGSPHIADEKECPRVRLVTN